MNTDFLNNILLYSTSAAAQVWAALLVFQVLLVRDQKAAILSEEDQLWESAKYRWGGLIQKLRDKNPGCLGTQLESCGLTDEIVHRVETDRKCFKKLMKETFEKQIIVRNQIPTGSNLNMQNLGLGPVVYQKTLDPISERLSQLQEIELNPRLGFFTGLGAIIANMAILLSLGLLVKLLTPVCLILIVGILNLIFVSYFGWQVLKSLENIQAKESTTK